MTNDKKIGDRLIKMCDMNPTDSPVCILPCGYVLMDPTPTESRILDLYAAAHRLAGVSAVTETTNDK